MSEGHGHPIKALHPIVVLAATIHKRLPQVLLYQNLFFGTHFFFIHMVKIHLHHLLSEADPVELAKLDLASA
jgi:hypothetical protein